MNDVKDDSTMALVRGAVGAVLGAVVGFVAFYFLYKYGLYALILPGAIAGTLAAKLSGRGSNALGIICVVVAIVATILSEWTVAPMRDDNGLLFFVMHLHQVRTIAWILGGAGIVFAFFSGRGSSII